ncbi:hypothetical protein KAI30_05315 [Candidatus Bathyarchaeota archaeon]|nr:hypothetical protein [Candidatus Bathyarchaeota archaeon]
MAKTDKENRFSEVDQQKLKRFGWYPFAPKLTQKILKGEKIIVIPTRNPLYTVRLVRGDKVVAYRTNTIKMHRQRGGVDHGETVYVLGVEGGKILQINEEGNVVNDSG